MVVLNTESCRTGTVEHSLYIGTVTFISGRPRASELQVTIDREEESELIFTAERLDKKACYFIFIF
jgi:hypothetical protein